VFLSYASQDGKAAARICDALRAAGIEVWFDQSELRGGDVWDQRIRREIHDCALFIPIVSQHTQARLEGYFRHEWKLAIERTHHMAEQKPFLVPVVIDNTSDKAAIVPDQFKTVQWTRLPAGETPSAFVQHVQRLLSPDASTTAWALPGAVSGTAPAIGQPVGVPWRSKLALRAIVVTLLAVAVLAIGAYAAWRARSGANLTPVGVEAPTPSLLPAHTVAVLPFENLSAEPSDGFLATGIAESVLHRLAAVKSLSVIARTSSFTFNRRDVDARDIGRKLNARYLVEGSVQRAGDRLRITAQLLDASSGSNVWSLRLERHMGDIFELEDEISDKVTDAVGVSLAAEPGKTPSRPTPKLDAYLAYIEGRSLLSTFKIADVEAGIERFKRATAVDPGFAAAYAEEAHALRMLSWMLHPEGGPTEPEIERQAAALNDKALSLDPELGEAWVERAYGRQQINAGFDATTDADFRKGLALAPNYAQGHLLYGEWLYLLGRTDDALAMLERARQLDPLAPRSHYMKGLILLDRGEVDQAAALLLEALRVNPRYSPALARLGELESSRGNFAEAAKLMERAIALDPSARWIRFEIAWIYLELGDVAAAQDVQAEIPPRAQNLCVLRYKGEEQRAAALLYALPREDLNTAVMAKGCSSLVIRDDALERRDYGRALRTLEVCLTDDWDPILSTGENYVQVMCAVRYTSILMANGERDRARKLLQAMLAAMQRHKLYNYGVAPGFVLALLGDTDAALTALEAGYAEEKGGWWYDIRAPELLGLRAHPRIQSLEKRVSDNAAKQAALLAAMRHAGEVPYRPPSGATAQ
jgi:TolB-like protein/tetratricopeptide (TPR) repeat protein